MVTQEKTDQFQTKTKLGQKCLLKFLLFIIYVSDIQIATQRAEEREVINRYRIKSLNVVICGLDYFNKLRKIKNNGKTLREKPIEENEQSVLI